MLEKIIEQPDYDYMDASYREYLIRKSNGIPINKDNNTLASDSEWVQRRRGTKKWKQITWVSPFKEGNRLRDVVTAYGNQVAVDYIYCSPCLIVPIAPASDRA